MGLDHLFEEDAVRAPGEEDLNRIEQLIQKQLQIETEIENLSIKMSKKTEELRHIQEHEIPDIFKGLNVKEIKLLNGTKVEIKSFYNASISPENEYECFKWLRENGLDDIIKHDIKITFGRGEDEDCTALKEELDKLNVNYIEKSAVHPQTLKATVKEQMELMSKNVSEGKDPFPMDLFKVFIGSKAKITTPKKKKER